MKNATTKQGKRSAKHRAESGNGRLRGMNDVAADEAILRSKANYIARRRAEQQGRTTAFLRKCRTCGKLFETNNARKMYCTPECADIAERNRGKDLSVEVERVMALPYDQRWQFTKDWTEEHRKIARKIEMRRIRDDADIDDIGEPTETAEDPMEELGDCPAGFIQEID